MRRQGGGEVVDRSDRLHEALKLEDPLLCHQGRVGLRPVEPRVGAGEDRLGRVEDAVARVARGIRGVLGVEARRRRRGGEIEPVDGHARGDDQRLVDRHAHLVRLVRRPVGREAGSREEARTRRLQHELGRGPQARELIEVRDGLGPDRRADGDHPPGGEVVRGELRSSHRPPALRTVQRASIGQADRVTGDRAVERPLEGVRGRRDRDRIRLAVLGAAIDQVTHVGIVEREKQRAACVSGHAERHRPAVVPEHDRPLLEQRCPRIDGLALVVHLPRIEEGVELHERRGHHHSVRGEGLGERSAFGVEGEHRPREALTDVLDQQRHGGPVAQPLPGNELDEVHRGDLRLLKGQLEEGHHLLVVLRQRRPFLDQRRQDLRVDRDGGDLAVRRREADQEVLHLRHRRARGHHLEGHARVERRRGHPTGHEAEEPRPLISGERRPWRHRAFRDAVDDERTLSQHRGPVSEGAVIVRVAAGARGPDEGLAVGLPGVTALAPVGLAWAWACVGRHRELPWPAGAERDGQRAQDHPGKMVTQPHALLLSWGRLPRSLGRSRKTEAARLAM